MDVAERIRAHGAHLTAAERRVATAILDAPHAVGFGTVADLARTADVGAASVVRLANKLGFDGYTELQHSIQHDLAAQLRPAAERIHEDTPAGPAAHARAEIANVRATVEAIEVAALDQLVERLADPARPVLLLSGDASAGVALQLYAQLQQLRRGVTILGGSPVAVRREIAVADRASTAIVIDLRRYERWVLEAHRGLAGRGIWTAGVTDGPLSPIAQLADVSFRVTAGSVGPFDSHVGTLALLNLVAVDVATAMRSSAADRLASIEAAWQSTDSLTDDAS
jgi:DNA-binding MurR/RpiR family transcriptional regulator